MTPSQLFSYNLIVYFLNFSQFHYNFAELNLNKTEKKKNIQSKRVLCQENNAVRKRNRSTFKPPISYREKNPKEKLSTLKCSVTKKSVF